MKTFFKRIIQFGAGTLLLLQLPALALNSSSTNFQILDAELKPSGAVEGTSTNFRLIGTLGDTAIGRTTSASFTMTSGSLTAPRCTSPTLTGQSGASSAILTWTASTCQAGWTLTGYEVCNGSTPDTYSACANVGNLLTSTRSATPSVAVFYRIRTIATGAASSGTPAGNVGARSGEIQVTASGGGTTGGGGGGAPVAAVTSVTLTAPNGGEKIVSGTNTNITWTSTGSGTSTIRLRLSGDGGLSFPTTIAQNESNDGTYTWTAPALTGAQFRVLVEGMSATASVVASDMSDNNFSIGPAAAVPEPIVAPTAPTVPTPAPPKTAAPSIVNAVTLILRGLAYPNASVTILRDGANVGFVSAGADGAWTMSLPNLTPGGLYTLVFQATDKAGRKSATSTRTVQLPNNAPTFELENLLSPPTLEASKTSVQPGENITFSGAASPGTSLTAEVGDLVRQLAISGSGLWEMIRSTVGLSGSLGARAKVSRGAESSGWSLPIQFTVGGAAVTPPSAKSADLNGDGRIGLTDFSRLVASWQKPSPPANIDLNGDGQVNLKDLSILLHRWTG